MGGGPQIHEKFRVPEIYFFYPPEVEKFSEFNGTIFSKSEQNLGYISFPQGVNS